jgi:ABC-type transport system involved in cytochrome c biogenesis permease subunit
MTTRRRLLFSYAITAGTSISMFILPWLRGDHVEVFTMSNLLVLAVAFVTAFAIAPLTSSRRDGRG